MALKMSLDHPHGEVHIHFAFLDEIRNERLLSDYESLLTEKEIERWQRFYFDRHKHQYLVTRALLRSTLSQFVDIDPRDWRFVLNEYGKPEIEQALVDVNIRFNVSHTDGLLMCGVTIDNDIGVDVEDEHGKDELIKIADNYFSKQEISDLYKLPANQQKHRFFEYWTLKESYIKARGEGLSLPLDQFTFHIDAGQSVKVSFDAGLKDDPEHWQFWCLRPSPRHIAAVAVKSEANRDYKVLTYKSVPLESLVNMSLPPV